MGVQWNCDDRIRRTMDGRDFRSLKNTRKSKRMTWRNRIFINNKFCLQSNDEYTFVTERKSSERRKEKNRNKIYWKMKIHSFQMDRQNILVSNICFCHTKHAPFENKNKWKKNREPNISKRTHVSSHVCLCVLFCHFMFVLFFPFLHLVFLCIFSFSFMPKFIFNVGDLAIALLLWSCARNAWLIHFTSSHFRICIRIVKDGANRISSILI